MKQQVPHDLSSGDPGSARLGENPAEGLVHQGKEDGFASQTTEALSEFKATEDHGQTDCLDKSEWLAEQRVESGRPAEKFLLHQR